MTRTDLTRQGDTYDLTCDELSMSWVFTERWLALQAQFALLKLLSWWDDQLKLACPVIGRSDFDYLVKFIMTAYEQPLTADVFRSLVRPDNPPNQGSAIWDPQDVTYQCLGCRNQRRRREVFTKLLCKQCGAEMVLIA